MRTLELQEGGDCRAWGHQHGEAFRDEINELAEIRLERTITLGRFRDAEGVLGAARRHLPVLYRYDRSLHKELMAISEASGCDPARLVVLNHYTDLRDLDPDHLEVVGGARLARDGTDPGVDHRFRPPEASVRVEGSGPIELGPPDEDCTVVLARSPEGDLLAQTWDMHASASPYVMMMHVPPYDHEGERVPGAWVLTVMGCLGMAGMNAARVGVTINNLWSDDAMVGLIWPALVRRALTCWNARDARHEVLSAPVSAGHHYLVADRSLAYGIEVMGTGRREVFDGPGLSFLHTNHCLDSALAEHNPVPKTSTSRERMSWFERSLEDAPIDGPKDLWGRLGSHEGHPKGICTHMNDVHGPHGTATCAGIVMLLARGAVWVIQGCMHGAEPQVFEFGLREGDR